MPYVNCITSVILYIYFNQLNIDLWLKVHFISNLANFECTQIVNDSEVVEILMVQMSASRYLHVRGRTRIDLQQNESSVDFKGL